MKHRGRERQERLNKNRVMVCAIVIIVLFLTTVFTTASVESGQRLIPLSVLALLAGVIFEGKRISEKWSTLLAITLGSLVASFLAFLPGKREHNYVFEDHIILWPYWFLVAFAIISIATYGQKVVPKLTEGITLLQSIALIYWVTDYGLLSIDSYFLRALLLVGLAFSLYSAFHAFTYTTLTRGVRISLSLWSSAIMLLFAIDNTIRVYRNDEIENTTVLTDGAFIALQYFLLGVSSVYIIQNLFMLLGYLPGRDSFFNARYFSDVRQLNREHIDRYSDKQVYIGHSLLCIVFAITIFSLNYYFQLLPRHLAIWSAFVIFPLFTTLSGAPRASSARQA
jgi:hypothetical protein